MTAKKFDNGKADLSLCPLPALEQMAYAFMLGEKKYGRYNYLSGGMESHRLVAACLRHVLQWQSGEDNDSESGITHLGHALACVAMLLDQQAKGVAIDTRRVLTGPAGKGDVIVTEFGDIRTYHSQGESK